LLLVRLAVLSKEFGGGINCCNCHLSTPAY
jgi:hypothetical protein